MIGAGLGGLSAAIHLRLQGRTVTVFEANETVGGRANLIESDGFRFDTGPSLLNYPWVFEELFAAAGRKFSDYVELIPVDPSIQFRWPDGQTFALSSNVQRLLAECERLEPGCGPRLMAFLRDAAGKYETSFRKLVTRNEDNPLRWLSRLTLAEAYGTGVWRSLDAELGRFFQSRYIREAFGSYGMYLGGSPFELPGLFTILAYGELAYGLWLPKGGIYGMVRAIERLARELGVHIHTRCRVERIETEAGRVSGVRLANGTLFRAPVVVSNVDVPTTGQELMGKAIQQMRTKRMTPGVITFYWGIKGAYKRFRHHTIFLPHDSRKAFAQLTTDRIPDELPFYVSIPSASDPDLAPPGDTAMFVLVPVPLLSQLPGIVWNETVSEVKRRVLEKLELPAERIGFEEIWTPPEWQKRFGLHDGSAFGAGHSLFQMGPFRHRNYSRQLPGLYYAGASTTPGTGMPMVILGGRMVAERVASHAH